MSKILIKDPETYQGDCNETDSGYCAFCCKCNGVEFTYSVTYPSVLFVCVFFCLLFFFFFFLFFFSFLILLVVTANVMSSRTTTPHPVTVLIIGVWRATLVLICMFVEHCLC